jgi:hypothetical protein
VKLSSRTMPVVAGAALASVIAVISLGGDRAGASTTVLGAPSHGPYSEQRNLFPVLDAPASHSDTSLSKPAGEFARAIVNAWVARGARPDGVRTIYSDSTTLAGVFPTDGGACLIAVSLTPSRRESGMCSATKDAAARGLLLGFQDENGNHLVGILPAGWKGASFVRGDGTEIPLPVARSGGYAVVTTSVPAAVVLTDAHGMRLTAGLPGGASGIVGG